ncbi:MAG: hypothetical protein DELT_01991 [Desulfovibrio sp.]
MKKTLPYIILLLGFLSFALFPAPAAAKYPEKAVTLIVPFGAGGSADLAARLIGKRLEGELGKPVVVENLVGGAGWVGWTKLTKAKPDGYTIAVFSLAYVPGYLNPANKRTMNLSNVTPLVNQTWDVTAWAVKPDSPYKDVKELMAYVKDNPGKIKVAVSITYSQHHLILLELAKQGYKMTPVHTSGVADSLAMVIGGHIDVASVGVGDVRRQMKDGALRPLAVMDTQRSPLLAETPTFLEAMGMEITGFAARGFAGPANMDPEAVKRLNEAFKKIMEDQEFIAEMAKMDVVLKYMDSAEYQEFLKKMETQYKTILGW